MKNLFYLIFLSILFFQFSNCKPEGKGKRVITLELAPTDNLAAVQQKTIEILKKRLESIGIAADDIQILPKENRLEVTISGMSNYPDVEAIRKTMQCDGNVELWETYTDKEIAMVLNKAMLAIDSLNFPVRLQNLLTIKYSMGANSCNIGTSKLVDTSKTNRLLDTLLLTKYFPLNFRFAWSSPRMVNNQMVCELIMLKTDGSSGARMPNPKFDNVEVKNGRSENEELCFYMSGFDADSWKRMTRDNVTKNIAIAVDGIVYTWPIVQGEITGGIFCISGPHESGDYEKLMAITSQGALPAPVRIVEEKTEE